MELSRELRMIMSHAFNKARELKNEYLMPEHILYSIVKNDEVIVDKLNIEQDDILEDLTAFFQTKIPPAVDGRQPVESLGFNQVIQASVQQVENSSRQTVEVGDILIAIFNAGGQSRYILQKYGIEKEDLLEAVTDTQRGDMETEQPEAQQPGAAPRKKKSMLEEYAVELVQQARDGKLDPIIGRDAEIERTVQILCRKKKNNPIHVGEAGVGKCLDGDEKIKILVSDELYEELKNFI